MEAVVWPMSEAAAVLLDRSLRLSEHETALEVGWLLAELEQRFGYGLDELARRFDRSVSWVSRRLALVEILPEAIQQQVTSIRGHGWGTTAISLPRTKVISETAMVCKTCTTDNSAQVSQCVSGGAELTSAQYSDSQLAETIASETQVITRSAAGGGSRSGLSPDRSLTLIPGTDFGPRYFIESVLGEGGMGKVYRAHDRELNRKVALKLIRPELAADPRSLDRLKQELLLASSISHKNILRIHDLGETEGIKFISMAYIEGNDLHDVLKETGKLPLDRAVRIARQLAGALVAAHAENVVHRDLKPRNILVDKSDQIYVADFGLAKSLEPASSWAPLYTWRPNRWKGSPSITARISTPSDWFYTKW